VGLLETLQPIKKSIVFSVSNFRIIKYMVAMIMMIEAIAQKLGLARYIPTDFRHY
jgi:hypothetical protein